jgi:hypothetical protein
MNNLEFVRLLKRATVHCLGFDHDNCAEIAGRPEDAPDFYDFINQRVLGFLGKSDIKPKIFIANDSLRQDICLDQWNVVHNMYEKDGQVVLNGSVFSNLEEIQKHLIDRFGAKVRSTELLKLLTADLWFEKNNQGMFYYDAFKEEARARYEIKQTFQVEIWKGITQDIKKGSLSPEDQKCLGVDGHHTYYDESKLFNIWLKIQALANQYPNESIVYHFVDDHKDYGEDLLELFDKFPALLPKNVTFAFHHFDDYEGIEEAYCTYTNQNEENIRFVCGTGVAHKNYKALAREMAETIFKNGQGDYTFNGVLDIEDGYCEDIFKKMCAIPEKSAKQTTADVLNKLPPRPSLAERRKRGSLRVKIPPVGLKIVMRPEELVKKTKVDQPKCAPKKPQRWALQSVSNKNGASITTVPHSA